MTEEQAVALAAEIRIEVANRQGCDSETSEEVQDKQMAVILKKLADWIVANP